MPRPRYILGHTLIQAFEGSTTFGSTHCEISYAYSGDKGEKACCASNTVISRKMFCGVADQKGSIGTSCDEGMPRASVGDIVSE